MLLVVSADPTAWRKSTWVFQVPKQIMQREHGVQTVRVNVSRANWMPDAAIVAIVTTLK